MPRFEYKVLTAPKKGVRAKGIKRSDAKFANALQGMMNEQAADNWEYLRSDTLPSEERSGLTGKTTVFQNVLVFRRSLQEESARDLTCPSKANDGLVQPPPEPIVKTRSDQPKETIEEMVEIPENVVIEPQVRPLGGVTKDAE